MPASGRCRWWPSGPLSALPAFGLDVSTGRQLGLVLFHLLATVAELVVVRQQLARWATA